MYQAMIEQLKQLNQRWYKGAELAKNGAFKTKEQYQSAVKRFSNILAEALPVYEQLQQEAPHLLEGVPLLPEPPTDIEVTGRWVGNAWIPNELSV